MGLEVDTKILRWLQSIGAVEKVKQTNNNKVLLNEQVAMRLYDGVLVSFIVKIILSKKDGESLNEIEKLDAIKNNSTPAIRLYNWNIICELLRGIGILVSYSDKSKILNLEPLIMRDLLEALYKKQQGHQQQQTSLEFDFGNLANKKVHECSNVKELLVISVSRNLNLSLEQSLNFFKDNNKYFAHLLVKGIKNNFEPIISFIDDLIENVGFIVKNLFLKDEKQSVELFLNSIKPAFISKQQQVVLKAIQILSQLYQTYQINFLPVQIISLWITVEGIHTLLFSIKRHPNTLIPVLSVLQSFLEEELFTYLQPLEKSALWQDDQQKSLFLLNFLTKSSLDNVKAFTASESFSEWLKYLAKRLKACEDKRQISYILELIRWIWENNLGIFESNKNNLQELAIQFFKNFCNHQSEIIFLNVIIIMFHLMEVLGNQRNPSAPKIFKILTAQLSQCSQNRAIEMSANLIESINRIQNLPGDPIMSSLLTQMGRGMRTEFINVCKLLMIDDKISDYLVIELLEILTRVVFHNVVDGVMCMDFIFESLLPSLNDNIRAQYLKKGMRNSLAQFYSICNTLKIDYEDLKLNCRRLSSKVSYSKEVQDIDKHLMLERMVMFYHKCGLADVQLRNQNEEALFYTYMRVLTEMRKHKQAQMLRPLLEYHYPDEEQLESKINEYEKELDISRVSDNDSPKNNRSQNSIENNSIENSQVSNSLKESDIASSFQPLELSTLRPSFKAVKDIEKIKNKIKNLKTLEQQKSRERQFLQQKKEMMRHALKEKRLVEFGSKGEQDLSYKCLLDWQTVKVDDPFKTYGIVNIKIMNMALEEEDEHIEEASWMMKKYHKIWKFLFMKFSTFGAKKGVQVQSEEKINIAEIWKIFREYKIQILKKQQSHTLVRLINECQNRRDDLQNLTFEGFESYIIQASSYGYNKLGYSYLTVADKITLFVKHLRNETFLRGGNVEIFDNPQQVYFQEGEVIKQLNKRLKQNKEYILPDGYKRKKQIQFDKTNNVSEENLKCLSSSYSLVLEILDEIISGNSKLNFHILEPISRRKQVFFAKPVLFQNIYQKIGEQKQRYLLTKPLTVSNQKQKQKSVSFSFKQQFHPLVNFSLGIKMGLAGVSMKNRFIADEVAYWMDDMLDAVEKGLNFVENRAKKKIQNQVSRNKRASLHKIKIDQKNEETKWRRRVQSVKTQAKDIQERKKQIQLLKAEQMRMQKIVEKIKEEEKMQKKAKEFNTVKQKLQEKRKIQENKELAEKLENKKKKQQYKKGVEEYFSKKKLEISNQISVARKQKQHQSQKKILEEEKKRDLATKLLLNIFKKQGSVLDRIEQSKIRFDDFWQSKQVSDKFQQYDTPLKLLFALLLKQQKSKIQMEGNECLSLNSLNLFSSKFRIVPFIINKDTLVKIYNILGRARQKNSGVDFDSFKEVLFRISIKGKDVLNGIVEKKKLKDEEISKLKEKKITQGKLNHSLQYEPIQRHSERAHSKRKATLTDQYIFDVSGVSVETLEELLKFLNLPRDKIRLQQRFRQALEQKNSKPKSLTIRELKSQFQ